VIDEKLKLGRVGTIPADQVNPDEKIAAGEIFKRDYATLPHDLATLKVYEGELKDLLEYWTSQVELHPEAPIYKNTQLQMVSRLQTMLLAQNRLDETQQLSEQFSDQAYKLAERYPDIAEYTVSAAWNETGRGCLLYLRGRREEAVVPLQRRIELMKRLVEKFPAEKRYHVHLLGLLLDCPIPELRDPERALAEANRVLEIDGQAGDIASYARAQFQAGRLEEAMTTLAKARMKAPPNAELCTIELLDLFEALIRYQQGDTETAQRLYQNSISTIDKTTNRRWYTAQYRIIREENDVRMGVKPLPDSVPEKSP
jgi:tetratricopeptide (TPR) repeat protein